MTFIVNEHTGVLIKKAARLFERVANINLDELQVTHAQTTFLMRLWEKDGQTQMELARSSGLKQPSVLGILQKMEDELLVKRVANKTDKRSFKYILTAKAKNICLKLEDTGELMQNIAINDISANDVKKFNMMIQKMIVNLENFLDSEEK